MEQVGLATYVAAAIFNAVALPPNMPNFMRDAIEAQAEAAQRLPDVNNVTTGSPGGGALGVKTKAEKQQEDDEEFSDWLTNTFEREREREREAWARTETTVAGVTMTGAQWQDMGNRLRDDEAFRRRLIELFEAEGASSADAAARVDKVAAVADAAATPPSQRSDAQKSLVQQANNDPQLKSDVQTAKDLTERKAAPRHAADSLSGPFEKAARGSETEDKPSAPVQRPIVTIAPGAAF